jgi:hypothetical protein
MMKRLMLLLSVGLITLAGACGDEGSADPSRFSGLSEAEMFTIVQGESCDMVVRCTSSLTKDQCITGWMVDDSAYQSPIADTVRRQVAECLDYIAKTDCTTLKNTDLNSSGACTGVFDTYVDLDKGA